MKKFILMLVLAVITSFYFLTITSCQPIVEKPLNEPKYTLHEMKTNNNSININEIYNYYYIEFKNNGEFVVTYNMVDDNVNVIEYGTYTKTDNIYVVNKDVLNFIIVANNII